MINEAVNHPLVGAGSPTVAPRDPDRTSFDGAYQNAFDRFYLFDFGSRSFCVQRKNRTASFTWNRAGAALRESCLSTGRNQFAPMAALLHADKFSGNLRPGP